MKIDKPSQFLALLAWVSLFTQTWLILLRIAVWDGLTIAGWLFFLAVAIMASSVASAGKPRRG